MTYDSPPGFEGYDYPNEEIERARKSNSLLRIGLETSRICNLRCLYCYSAAGSLLPGELSFEELTDAIDQAVGLGAKSVVLICGGEGLMFGRVFDLIKYIDHTGVNPVLFTNGTLVTKKTAEFLYERNASVVAKLNSFSPQFQEFLNGGIVGSHEQMMKGLKNLMDAGLNKSTPSRLAIETVMIKENYDELPRLWEWARDRNIHPYFEILRIAGRATLMRGVNLTNEEVKKIFYKLLDTDRTKYNYDWTPLLPIVAQSCRQHYYSCYVTSTGQVWPCSGVTINTGNIKSEKLADILQKPVYKKLRRMQDNIKGKCSSCPHAKSYCYGCRGRAYAATQDVFAEDASCWRAKT